MSDQKYPPGLWWDVSEGLIRCAVTPTNYPNAKRLVPLPTRYELARQLAEQTPGGLPWDQWTEATQYGFLYDADAVLALLLGETS